MRVHAHEHPSTMPSEKPRRKLKIRRKKGGFEKGIFYSSPQNFSEKGGNKLSLTELEYLKANTKYDEGDIREWYRWYIDDLGGNQKCISNLCFHDHQGFQG